jgi:hypothetical protein
LVKKCGRKCCQRAGIFGGPDLATLGGEKGEAEERKGGGGGVKENRAVPGRNVNFERGRKIKPKIG